MARAGQRYVELKTISRSGDKLIGQEARRCALLLRTRKYHQETAWPHDCIDNVHRRSVHLVNLRALHGAANQAIRVDDRASSISIASWLWISRIMRGQR